MSKTEEVSEEAQKKPPPLLHLLRRELHWLSDDCKLVQDALGVLLSAVPSSIITDEIQVLQIVDRMEQTLSDLSEFMLELEKREGDFKVETYPLAASIRLKSLRSRLFPVHGDSQKPDSELHTDITWL